MTEKPSETLPIAVPANQLPVVAPVETISPSALAKLAREIAMDIKELPDILAFYKLTLEQYEIIKANSFFKNALETATVEWNGALNTHERIKIEAAAILEEGMPALAARMGHKDEAFPAAVEAGKLFAKIAGIGEESRGQAAPGEKFTINISLGADTKLHFEKDVTPAKAEGSPGALRALPEGAGDKAPV